MATDYVLRVLFERLSRAFLALLSEVSSGSGMGVVPNYDTVADLLAADPINVKSFATCSNFELTDGVKSLWLRSADAVSDNGSDVRESTAVPGIFYERVWVKEF